MNWGNRDCVFSCYIAGSPPHLSLSQSIQQSFQQCCGRLFPYRRAETCSDTSEMPMHPISALATRGTVATRKLPDNDRIRSAITKEDYCMVATAEPEWYHCNLALANATTI